MTVALWELAAAANRRRNREDMALITSPRNPPSEAEAFEQDVRGLAARAEQQLFATRVRDWAWVIEDCERVLRDLRRIQMKEATS